MTPFGDVPSPAGVVASPSRFQTCGHAWIALMEHVLASARHAADDRGPVLEGVAALFEIASLSRQDPVLAEYGSPEAMALYDRKFTEDVVWPPFKYSYGARLRDACGVNQLDWAVGLLAARPYSKSAWISLTMPGERFDAVPCLAAVAFRVRDGLLHASAAFRSQNAYTSYLNYLPLRDIQAEVARRLSFPPGPMRVYVDVPHVYVADAPEVSRVLRAAPAPRTNLECEGPVRGTAD